MPDKSLPNTEVYDDRYSSDYRQHLSGFEVARWSALSHFIAEIVQPVPNPKVLDYGAGAGLHVELWESCFDPAELHFCDISIVARERFAKKFPHYLDYYSLCRNGIAPFDDEKFDVVVSVEVMEHVEDLDGYLRDIFRVLKSDGVFVWTTPCGNRGSIEHIWTCLSGQIVPTAEGYRVWAWEDPTHLRRLRTGEIDIRLRRIGFLETVFRFRSHIFSFVGTYTPPQSRLRFLRERMMMLDYRLFRRLSNGASMLGAAHKSVSSAQSVSRRMDLPPR